MAQGALLLGLLGPALLAPLPSAQDLAPIVRKLNGPLARRTTRDVTAFRLSEDGTRAVYLADPARDDAFALFGVPADGSGPAVRLSPDSGNPFRIDGDFQLARDGAWVAFRASVSALAFRLYATPAAGGGPLVQLDPFTIPGEAAETGYRFSGDGRRVVYRADRTVDGVPELWSAAVDGSTPPVRLNDPLPAGGRVLEFALTPDGTRAVYRADQRTDEVFELFGVPVDAGAPPLRLSGNLVNGGDVAASFRVDPLGARVVYVADQETNNTFYLYSVPLDGSTPAVRLMPFNTSQNFEPDFVITGDGQRVAYRFFVGGRTLQLFGAPIDGSAPAILLTAALGLPESGVQPGFRAGPGGDVLFRAPLAVGGSLHLFTVPAGGASAAVRLDDLPDLGGQVLEDFRSDASGARALFRTTRDTDPTLRLHSAPRDGATPAVDLAGTLAPGGNVLAFQERAGFVSYVADQELDEVHELYQVPAAGAAPAERLSDGPTPLADVQLDLALAPDGRTVLFRADARRDEAFELFATAPDRIDLALNPPFDPATDAVASVASFAVAGERVVYRASEVTFGATELHSVPLHGGGASVILNPLEPEVQSYRISPDLRQVVYVAGEFFGPGLELFSVPVDGSAPPTRRNGELVAGGSVRFSFGDYQVSADGQRVVYLADQRVDGQFELFSAPLRESGVGVVLTPLRGPAREVAAFELTPDSRRVVYVADQDFDERYELYSVPIDGARPPVCIAAMQNAGGSLARFQLAADSQRVVYYADQLLNDQYELFVTRVDGSVPTRRLSTPLFPGGDVRTFRIGTDLEHVLYEADRDSEQIFQLFSVPLRGSSALGRELTPPLTRATKVMDSRLTPDGATALWVDRAFQLWSAPADAQAPARLLHGGFPAMHGVSPFDFAPSPDSTRAVYLADPARVQRWELFSVPLAGGATPVRLHPPLTGLRRVWSFLYAPDGRSLAYVAAQEAEQRRELFLVPIDGSAAPLKLNAALVAGGSVKSFQFGAGEREGVYLADQDTDGVLELYATVLPTPGARGRPR